MILFSALWFTALAASPPWQTVPAFRADQLPAKAARTAAFVPTGWLQERLISGDLNGDNRPDPVLMLIERPSPTAPEARRERALVVLLAEPTGQLRRVAASATALYCTGCNESATGAAGAPQLSISKGELIVRQVAGNNKTLELTQRFRFEASSGRLRLVSEDQARSERQVVNTTLQHTDFLTGQQQTERIYSDPNDKTGARQLTSRTAATVPKAPRYVEEVQVGSIGI